MSVAATIAAPTPQWRWHRAASLVAVVITVVASVVAIRTLVSRISPVAAGPLDVNVGTWMEFPVAVGEEITVGVSPHNTTQEAAVIDGVSLFGSTEGIRILGSRVLFTSAAGGIGTLRRFPPPPRYPTEPLRGTAIADTDSHPVQLLLGLEALRPGRYLFPGVLVDYHVGSTRYRTILLEGLILCAGQHAAPSVARCSGSEALQSAQERIRAIAFPGG